MGNQAGRANKPWRVEIVQGEPYEVVGRRLTPVARVTSAGRARATLRRERVEGWAGGFCQVTPLAVIEETQDGQQYVAITDATGTVLRRLLLMAVAVTLLFVAVRRLAAGSGRR